MEISTCDLYEGSFYLLGGCELEAIEGFKVDGAITCRLTFSGDNLNTLQITYLQGEAQAKLFEFRRTYSQLSSLVMKAKKKFRNQLKQEAPGPQKEGGEA